MFLPFNHNPGFTQRKSSLTDLSLNGLFFNCWYGHPGGSLLTTRVPLQTHDEPRQVSSRGWIETAQFALRADWPMPGCGVIKAWSSYETSPLAPLIPGNSCVYIKSVLYCFQDITRLNFLKERPPWRPQGLGSLGFLFFSVQIFHFCHQSRTWEI